MDIGAVPISFSSHDDFKYRSFNFSVGYQVTKNLDLRINYERLDEKFWFNHELWEYQTLSGISLGANYKIFRGKSGSLFENTSSSIFGKFGFTLNEEFMEQESWFFDLSTRIYIGQISYLGIGVNYQIEPWFYILLDEDITSLYFTFGIDF